jgi:branched-chain amino acid transport system permease protein
MAVVIVQTIANGLSIGLVYVLMATGFTLIYGIGRIFNFAHGALYMIGAFVLYVFMTGLGLNYFVALLLAILTMAIFGVILEYGLFRPARGNDLRTGAVSIALLLFLTNIADVIWTEKSRGVGSVFPGVLHLGPISLSAQRVAVIVLCLIIVAALQFFTQRTRIGQSLRAVAQDREAATIQGISINRVFVITMAIGVAMAAAAAALVAPMFYINPSIATPALTKSVIVVIVGGLGSISGAFVAGIGLGLAESFGYTFLGTITSSLLFLIAILTIMFRPQGILGHEAG